MPLIRPSADLRNNYNEISKICHQTQKPIYITKNGYNDLVLLSTEAFEQYEEHRINKLVSEQFAKKYSDFENFKKDIYQKIEKGLNDIKNGNYSPAIQFFEEMEEKYNIDD